MCEQRHGREGEMKRAERGKDIKGAAEQSQERKGTHKMKKGDGNREEKTGQARVCVSLSSSLYAVG